MTPKERMALMMMPGTLQGFGVQDVDGDIRAEGENLRKFGTSAAASAVDPFNLPSAALGLVSPGGRDAWREAQREGGAVPNLLGAGLSGVGATSAAFNALKTLPQMVGFGALTGGGSDVVDAASGKEGALNSGTALKTVVGGASALPPGMLLAGGGALAGGALVADQAMAQGKPKKEEKLPNGYLPSEIGDVAKQLGLPESAVANMRRAEISKALGERAGATAVATANAEANERALAAQRKDKEAGEAAGKIRDQSGAAQKSFDEIMASRSSSDTPYKDTWLGRNVNSTALPIALGLITGGALGLKGGMGQSGAAKRWAQSLDEVEKAATPSASLAAKATADSYATDVFPKGASALNGYVVPGAAGGLEGVGGAYLPTIWDRSLNKDNVERKAIQKAIDELPKGHPDRARWEERLQAAPPETPAYTAAKATDMGELTGTALARGAMGASAAAFGKTMGGLVGPSATKISELHARSGKGNIQPSDVAEEGQRMLGVKVADRGYESGVESLPPVERRALPSPSQGAAETVERGAEVGQQKPPARLLPEPSQPAVTSTDLQPLPPFPIAANSGAQGATLDDLVNEVKGLGKIFSDRPQQAIAPPVNPPAPVKVDARGARENPAWEPYSATARAELDQLLGQGRTLGNSGRGLDIKANEILSAVNKKFPNVGESTVQDRMDQLRKVLIERGYGTHVGKSKKVSISQDKWRGEEGSIPTGTFALPLLVGGAAAGMSAKDRMILQMMGEEY
jgi:hypothetical protein